TKSGRFELAEIQTYSSFGDTGVRPPAVFEASTGAAALGPQAAKGASPANNALRRDKFFRMDISLVLFHETVHRHRGHQHGSRDDALPVRRNRGDDERVVDKRDETDTDQRAPDGPLATSEAGAAEDGGRDDAQLRS